MYSGKIYYNSITGGHINFVLFPPQNYNSQSIGLAIQASLLPLLAPLHENTTQMSAWPCGPRHWSITNAPAPYFFARSMSALWSCTCRVWLRPRHVYD